jgi:hypothetical protein
MFSQLSGEVSVALAIRIAISGLKEDLSLISSERVFLDTPSAVSSSSDRHTQRFYYVLF